MNTYILSSKINPIKLLLVTIVFLSLGHFTRGTSFFYFIPAFSFLTIIVLNKYALRNKYIILSFLICAFIPFPTMALSIDIARDLTFLMYFFASALIGHTIARYMPLEYLVYGLFLAGSYVTLLVLIKLIVEIILFNFSFFFPYKKTFTPLSINLSESLKPIFPAPIIRTFLFDTFLISFWNISSRKFDDSSTVKSLALK